MAEFSTPDLADEAPEVQAIGLGFNSYGGQRKFFGQAVTIKCHEDNSLPSTLGSSKCSCGNISKY